MKEVNGCVFTAGILIGLLFGAAIVVTTAHDFEDYTRIYTLNAPYCIERQVGAENIKRCYFVKEATCETESHGSGLTRQNCKEKK